MRLPEARGLPAVQRAATIIRRTVVSQAQIIDDLLDLSRINTGKLRLNRTGVDWQAAVEAIVSAVRDEAQSKGVSISTSCGDEPLIVDADQVRVEQIVWTLLSNAMKFTPPQGSVCDEAGNRHPSQRYQGRRYYFCQLGQAPDYCNR